MTTASISTMKIASVECLPVHSGWRKNFVFVRLATDAGIVGWGEAYSQYDRDRAVAAQVEELGRYLIGRDPFHIRHILQIAFDDYAQRRGSLELYCATSGIEQALWDIAGKITGQPVYNLLGGPCRSRVRVYANGWSYKMQQPQDYARAAEAVLAARIHRVEVRSAPGPLAHLHPQGAHPARGKGHPRRARRGRPRCRYPDRGAPAARPDARHRSRQCAGGIRAVLVRGAVPVGERRGAGGSPPRQPHSGRDRRDAARPCGFSPDHPRARRRYHQSRRLQLRRHSRAHAYCGGRRNRGDRRLAAQL